MANRRMFSKAILDSDLFFDLPFPTQSLYIQLNMNADDDGFIGSPQKIIRMVGADKDDIKKIVDCGLLMDFDNGIYAVTHWNVHNQIRKDRLTETIYQREKAMLKTKKDGTYTWKRRPNDNHPSTNCPPSIEKDSLGEYSGKRTVLENSNKEYINKEKNMYSSVDVPINNSNLSEITDLIKLWNSKKNLPPQNEDISEEELDLLWDNLDSYYIEEIKIAIKYYSFMLEDIESKGEEIYDDLIEFMEKGLEKFTKEDLPSLPD